MFRTGWTFLVCTYLRLMSTSCGDIGLQSQTETSERTGRRCLCLAQGHVSLAGIKPDTVSVWWWEGLQKGLPVEVRHHYKSHPPSQQSAFTKEQIISVPGDRWSLWTDLSLVQEASARLSIVWALSVSEAVHCGTEWSAVTSQPGCSVSVALSGVSEDICGDVFFAGHDNSKDFFCKDIF